MCGREVIPELLQRLIIPKMETNKEKSQRLTTPMVRIGSRPNCRGKDEKHREIVGKIVGYKWEGAKGKTK